MAISTGVLPVAEANDLAKIILLEFLSSAWRMIPGSTITVSVALPVP
ncbi:MAG: hypothetical protein U9P49_02365 [Thermodesulfobacteriota bacterium]|nr:hypothetical protein [Thermodesulfobacteriota bacterium]